jgi:hypothetical protein
MYFMMDKIADQFIKDYLWIRKNKKEKLKQQVIY